MDKFKYPMLALPAIGAPILTTLVGGGWLALQYASILQLMLGALAVTLVYFISLMLGALAVELYETC